MNLIHFQRRPSNAQVSIERLFTEIRRHLPIEWRAHTLVCPQFSRGLLPRIKNLLWASRKAGTVNHIVGDSHYLAFALPRRGLVLTIHDCAALNRLTGWRLELVRYFWFLGPMRKAEVVTTISETTKSELKRWTGALADSVRVIPNCVSDEFLRSPKEFGSPPIVLQVGTGWNKNMARVAEAMRGTNCHLEIVGDLRSGQREQLEAAGVPFRVLGKITDTQLVEAYRRCDIVVFTSLYEGFGLPVVEAQAIGRPVVTSDRSSLPETAGEGALFVDPEDETAIRRAVLSIVQDASLRKHLLVTGFKNVERFAARRVALQYAEVYNSVKT